MGRAGVNDIAVRKLGIFGFLTYLRDAKLLGWKEEILSSRSASHHQVKFGSACVRGNQVRIPG